MTEPTTEKADCYSAGERAAMEASQDARAWLFGPFVRVMTRLGVTADHLTLLSLIAGLAFCPLYFWSRPAAFVMLGIHVLLDGLDGPLARHQGTASRRGSFTDTVSDQTVVAATTIAMMLGENALIGVAAGGTYLFVYTVVVTFAMVRNALRVPYSWVVRPRFVVYTIAALECFAFPGTMHSGSLTVTLWVLNGLLGIKMLSGVLKLRSAL